MAVLVPLTSVAMVVSTVLGGCLSNRFDRRRLFVGAGHTIHRDDFDGFMASLEGWVQDAPPR